MSLLALKQDEIARLFVAIREDDPNGVIDQFASLTSASQYRKLYALTARYVLPGSAVLDWGCGRGHFSYYLVKQGFQVTAYSLEHPPEIFSALSADERKRLTFVQGTTEDARRLPFPSGHFAAVFSVGVLEHVRELGGDEMASLLELRRVLASDGALVCYHLPNRYSYIEAASRGLHGLGWDRTSGSDCFHRHRYTKRDIRALCSEAGLEPAEVGRYGFVPRNSFNRLPKPLRESRLLASAVNLSDSVLERVFSPVVQNHYFVARRRHDARGMSRHEVA
jgi:SAM-dependent methyltransferase